MKILKILGISLGVLVIVAGAGLYWAAGQIEPDLAIGSPSPDVTFSTLDGESLPLASLRGKVVLLDFWGST